MRANVRENSRSAVLVQWKRFIRDYCSSSADEEARRLDSLAATKQGRMIEFRTEVCHG